MIKNIKLSNKIIYTITVVIVLFIFGINYKLLYTVSFKKPDNYTYSYFNVLNKKQLSHYYVFGANNSQLLIMTNSNCNNKIIFNTIEFGHEYPVYEVICHE
jgi:hypothetical protein